MMIRQFLVVSLLSIAPVSLQAEGPATRPSSLEQPEHRGDHNRRPPMGGMGGMGGGPGGMRREDPTADEIEKARSFAKENFPNRYAAYEALPDAPRLRRMATNRLVNQWRRLTSMRENQPEMYDALMREQRSFDEAFGLMRDVRDNKPGAEDKLRAKIAEMVENQLNDRQARIEKLEKTLAEQKDQLARDRSRKDELIEQRRDQLDKDTRPLRDRDDREDSAAEKSPQDKK